MSLSKEYMGTFGSVSSGTKHRDLVHPDSDFVMSPLLQSHFSVYIWAFIMMGTHSRAGPYVST